MNVLVVNCGSSSLKFQLINSETEEVAAKGLCERIGIDGRLVYQPTNGEKEVTEAPMPTHTEAIKMVLDALVNEKTGVLKSLDEVEAIGHRVLHGGAKISDSCIINDEVISVIEECCDLGPLHNPANLMGIRACMELMPGKPNVAVFDTAFHQTMPEKAYMYAIPKKYYAYKHITTNIKPLPNTSNYTPPLTQPINFPSPNTLPPNYHIPLNNKKKNTTLSYTHSPI